MSRERITNSKKNQVQRTRRSKPADGKPAHGRTGADVERLQHRVGNRAVQRMLIQRSGEGPAELDNETAARINRERSGGQDLDGGVQTSLGEAMGQDFSEVRVHTSKEADTLNQELGARAFTTGQDVFFREGEYDPHSSAGKELIAHELTHVAQQGSGAASGGSRMTVNEPGDAFEQEAEATAKSASAQTLTTLAGAAVQREPEEEEMVQQAPEEEELVQQQPEEEEEMVQQAEMPEEEEAQQ